MLAFNGIRNLYKDVCILKMAALLELVLTGQIQSEVFLSWLCNKLPKEDVPAVLSALAAFQPEFVPYFLSYLREQATPHIQDLQHSGLTPRKAVSVTKSGPRNARSQSSSTTEHSTPIRTRLSFGSHGSQEEAWPVVSRERVTPSTEPKVKRKPKHNTSHDTENRRFQNRAWSEQKSQQKLSLGLFITGKDSSAGQKKGWQKQDTSTKEKVLNLNDQEAFPPMGATLVGKKSQNTRRITPTPVKHQQACLPGSTPIPPVVDNNIGSFSPAFIKSPTEAVPNDLHLERELLKEEREKLLSEFITSDHKETTLTEPSPPSEGLRTRIMPTIDLEMPSVYPSEVIFGDKLDMLAQIYSGCINANLTPDLVVELYFVMQLLTVRGKCGPDIPFDSDTEQYFCCPSNCVHFAIQLLWLQRRLLQLLDKGTLRLLLDNPRLQLFSPQLAEFLEWAYNRAESSMQIAFPPVGNVAFQSETDNRTNFVNDQEFHSFRRKRDSFYELLREWEANHHTSGWSTATILGSRIRTLVFGGEAAASSHLARLFQGQLLAMCKTNPQIEDNDFLSGSEPLTALRQTNPEKFKRLQERFVTAYHSVGPCPPPSFPGYQEFFKTFISAAASHPFNQHLIDGFTAKIHELNKFQLSLAEGEFEKEQSIDSDVREQFQTSLLTLRLLAKFLGYIVFMPYRTSERIPESVLSSQIQLRFNTCPPLDINGYLRDAINSKRTVLVTPWIVEFLSMMDAAAPFLHCYQQPLKMLYVLYRSESLMIGCADFSYNQFLIILLLGWLFEVIGFRPTLTVEELETSTFFGQTELDIEFSPVPVNALDMVNIIDQSIIYTCCPYLGEIRALLSEFAKGICSRAGSVRKIKPISADRNLSGLSTGKQIELQLEENFFHNHPVSMKRIVEFAIERISSNVIKHVRVSIVESVRSRASRRVVELAGSFESVDASHQVKMAAAKKIMQLAKDVAEEVQTETMTFASDYCPKRANVAVPVLLPDETLPEVAMVCIKIVQRQVLKKVSQWSSAHITTDVFYKELLNELQKVIKQSSLSKKDNVGEWMMPVANKHDADVPAPAEILITAKAILRRLYAGADFGISDVKKVVDVLQTIQVVIESRGDLTPMVFKMLVQLTVDFAVGLVVRYPGSIGGALEDAFISFWLFHPALVASPLLALLCPRNLQYLLMSEKTEAGFVALEDLAQKCIYADLISPDVFRERCIETMKQDWPKHFLLRLVECVGGILYRDKGAKLPSLEEWLAEPDPIHDTDK